MALSTCARIGDIVRLCMEIVFYVLSLFRLQYSIERWVLCTVQMLVETACGIDKRRFQQLHERQLWLVEDVLQKRSLLLWMSVAVLPPAVDVVYIELFTR